MTPEVREALARDRIIDITTTGRKTGQPHRKEIWFHNLEGRFFITGWPGKRDWYANLLVRPGFTFHLKDSTQADLPAIATPVVDPAKRREIIAAIHQELGWERDMERWVSESPLVEVELAGF